MVTVRPATPDDSARILAWSNDPHTRAMSFQTAPIPRADHERWYAALLADPLRRLGIGVVDGADVGMVRLTHDGAIGIVVAPEVRGRGFAAPLIRAGLRAYWPMVQTEIVTARIKPENIPSRRAFARAGFVDVRDYSPYAAVTMMYSPWRR